LKATASNGTTKWNQDAASDMTIIDVGDRVRIDIPDKTDPDHARLHGTHGNVVDVVEDDAGRVTGDSRDSYLYKVRTEENGTVNARWVDLRLVR
jgi:ribosomal protein L21E